MPKGFGECLKVPEAGDAARQLATLSHGLQGSQELKTTLTTSLKVGAKAKTHESIVTHVEAYLEETHHSPLPGAPNVEGFHVARTRGTTRQTQRFKRKGLYA
jgi:hypothetical protein